MYTCLATTSPSPTLTSGPLMGASIGNPLTMACSCSKDCPIVTDGMANGIASMGSAYHNIIEIVIWWVKDLI